MEEKVTPGLGSEALREALTQRITDYLTGGGVFNAEMALHDRVRDLLIDCRAALSLSSPTEPPPKGRFCPRCGELERDCFCRAKEQQKKLRVESKGPVTDVL